MAALLSLPHPEDAPPLTLSPQKQKQKTQEALVAWLMEEAERAPVYCIWEDLHWADPSTLELLGLLLDQVPTTRLLVLLTARPEFTPPWISHSYLSQLTLNRLGRQQVREIVGHVAKQAVRASTGSARTSNISLSDSDSVRPELVEGHGALPDDLVDAVIARTDGVPLFAEELTKSVIESVGSHGYASATLGIPSTLQDALMARLDRLGVAKEVAQLGATLGREFSYELIHAVALGDEANLQHALTKLVEAEVPYQRGLPPQARYIFKHALIQDAAYQSLLKSKRQQLHQQIAQVMEERFPETKETQPELLAHHYTEAGLVEQAIPYWQQAGQRASQRSAHVEAINHLTKGLELLKTLPDTSERVRQELTLQIALGGPLIATKGYAAPEVGEAYARARELCRQVGEAPQLFPILRELWAFYNVRGKFKEARELGEQRLTLAQRQQDSALLAEAHYALGNTLFWYGEFIPARISLEQGIAIHDPQQHRSRAFLYGQEPCIGCLSYGAWVLWFLGYPDRALKKSHEALTLARELSHSYSLAFALYCTAHLHQLRRERQSAQERAEATIMLCNEQGFPYFLVGGTMLRGLALAEQGQIEEGIAQMHQGTVAMGAMGAELGLPC